MSTLEGRIHSRVLTALTGCYIQEVFNGHYELPELGPLGANGLANARDFEHPVAYFEIDQGGWESVYKIMGELHSCKQEHSPFDVVAYHGKRQTT